MRFLTARLALHLPVLALGLVFASPTALACGGFFCSQVNVDQTAERVLFEVHPNETISVTVEIQLTGDSEDFSWVIPLPDLLPPPEDTYIWGDDDDGNDVGDDDDSAASIPPYVQVPPSALTLLDGMTSPQIIAPPQYGWDDLGDDDDDDADFGDDDDVAGGSDEDGGVVVEDLAQVGNYLGQLITSTDPEALIDWLNDNGYLITPEMEPYVAGYVAQGMSFLGIQLQPDTDSSPAATPPLMITYSGTQPMLPLTLTSVSAQPEMGFIVFVAGAENYQAENYASLPVQTEMVQADPRTGASNYYGLLSYLADEENGHAFFHEYSDSMTNLESLIFTVWLGTEDQEDAELFASNLASRHDRITRLYTRMSNWEMTQDPVFTAIADGTEVVSRVHDLSDRDPIHIDFEVMPPVACADTYCGPGGSCATTQSGLEGCICDSGYVARAIIAPAAGNIGNRQTVACQLGSFNLLGSAASTLSDPCDGFSCGTGGTCVPLNGTATCVCGGGYAAVNIGGTASCSLAEATYEADQLLWPNWPPEVEGDDDDDDTGSSNDDDDDDDDAGDGEGSDGSSYDGLNSRIDCGCVASGVRVSSGHALGLVLLMGFGLGALRRRR